MQREHTSSCLGAGRGVWLAQDWGGEDTVCVRAYWRERGGGGAAAGAATATESDSIMRVWEMAARVDSCGAVDTAVRSRRHGSESRGPRPTVSIRVFRACRDLEELRAPFRVWSLAPRGHSTFHGGVWHLLEKEVPSAP